MKIVSRHIERDGSGNVTLIPEEDEDMYHLYNLIEVGDEVRATAVRRVQSESSTGSIESHRVRLNLTLSVTKLSFDASGSTGGPIDPLANGANASSSTSTPGAPPPIPATEAASTTGALGGGSGSDGATLQVSGRVVEENPYVKMGAYHTLDLECDRKLSIRKPLWDSIHLERLNDAGDVGQRAEVGAVVLGQGTAVVCLLTEHMTVVRQRIDVPLPRKHKALASTSSSSSSSSLDRATSRFHAQVYAAVLKLLRLPALRLVLLASPGFTRDAVYEYLFAEATRRGDKELLGAEARRRFVRIHCSSPHVHSLMEVLRSPEVTAQLKDTKFAREGQLLDQFQRTLAHDELRAWYGEAHVRLAASRGAVAKLLISDGLFRSPQPERRRSFVALVDEVRSQGGEVAIFSTMHESGRQLNGLTGVAAILRFPLDVEVVEEEEREEEEARRKKGREEQQEGQGEP